MQTVPFTRSQPVQPTRRDEPELSAFNFTGAFWEYVAEQVWPQWIRLSRLTTSPVFLAIVVTDSVYVFRITGTTVKLMDSKCSTLPALSTL